MQPSSAEFEREILSGARMASRVSFVSNGSFTEDTFYDESKLLLIPEGSSVSYERISDTRTTAELEFLVKSEDALDLVDPTRFPEIEIHSGVFIGNEWEWISMGTLGIHSTTFSRSSSNSLRVTCSCADRSSRIRDNPWKKPFQIANASDYFQAIKSVIDDRAKGFSPSYNFSSSVLTTPTITYGEDTDPWKSVLDLAKAVSCEAYFDRQGILVAQPVPDPLLKAPVIRLDSTSEIQILPVSRSISNREVYNGVICRGEAPWLLFPVSGEVWDEDPISPSYRYGSFGEKPMVIGDALATTDAQCETIAVAEFKRIAGVMEQISFGTLKDPRFEVGDIVDQYDPDLGVAGRFVLDSYLYPLGTGIASGSMRRKR